MRANDADLGKPQAGLSNVGLVFILGFFNDVGAACFLCCFCRKTPGLGQCHVLKWLKLDAVDVRLPGNISKAAG